MREKSLIEAMKSIEEFATAESRMIPSSESEKTFVEEAKVISLLMGTIVSMIIGVSSKDAMDAYDMFVENGRFGINEYLKDIAKSKVKP